MTRTVTTSSELEDVVTGAAVLTGASGSTVIVTYSVTISSSVTRALLIGVPNAVAAKSAQDKMVERIFFLMISALSLKISKNLLS